MRAVALAFVTGLLLVAPVGGRGGSSDASLDPARVGTATAGERKSTVTGGPGVGSPAPASSYWVAEWRRRYRLEHRANLANRVTVRRLRSLLNVRLSPSEAVCAVFGRYCSQALSVAWCESRMYVGATNGQYRGLFQMGESERRTYGHGPTAVEQAQAAYRYFVASGSDWSPWSCQP